ncbi:hypothetical protein CaCOL14_008869 [Colletotrichum acutatum]|uniref:Uncharacterized protein n=5 Tax=Colletotrichum acutatum species complex TaxID=2707335 RepID=A0A9Q8WLN9_9PEZI|nr:uncharacterized protein CLUP02_13445 [Colletotrichum lupini]XP_060314444.1 uncharacterized protein CCOS01_06576 [Colletotrichum costaricense]XP_060387706.1 uncharacterized protein CTAM01_01203 [Colletotrichum tamarilloi]XP_060400521.1 uncharacterized protein CABS01_09437 [Colletotrichum abscissum]KAI3540365.1 hypothetical protein CSPX01_08277 [Colletotrichum filicis]KAK0376019.1 hypothetical protein CLIM01_06599 [Colletotrichum limetticola]KAK1454995.1 hypothetical protein CMEL01_03755 [Co
MQIKAVVLFLTATLLGSASAFCSKDDCCFKDNVARDKHNGDAFYCLNVMHGGPCHADCCTLDGYGRSC